MIATVHFTLKSGAAMECRMSFENYTSGFGVEWLEFDSNQWGIAAADIKEMTVKPVEPTECKSSVTSS